jgi:hypothetical protein
MKCLPAIDLTISKHVHAAASRSSSDVDNERPTEVPTAMFFSSAKFIETAAAGFCRICLQVMLQPSRGHTWHLCESCLTSLVHGARLGIDCAHTRGKPVQKRAETRTNRIRNAAHGSLNLEHFTPEEERVREKTPRQRRREGNDAPPASALAGSARRSKSPSFSNMER